MMECVKVGFRLYVIYEMLQWDFISEMVLVNFGIGLLLERICCGFDFEKVSIILFVYLVILWYLVIIWWKDCYMFFVVRVWLEYMKLYLWNLKKRKKDD